MKTSISIQESLHNLWLNLLIILYCSAPIGLGSLLLLLTPKLWEPSNWGPIWAKFVSGSFLPDASPLEKDTQGRRMTFEEANSALTTGDFISSKFYGPGVYLGWLLLTYSAAVSSIANAKCASNNPQKLKLNWELIPALSYPLIAALDIALRLISCKIDSGITAAISVMFTTLSIFEPTCRLSVQREGADLVELFDGLSWFCRNMRFVAWLVPCWICHAILAAVLFEPYSNVALIRALYPLLFLVVAYSGMVGDSHFEKGKYITPYRPWQERVAVFCVVQLGFMTALLRTGSHSLWPRRIADILEIDQAVPFACAAIYICASNRSLLVLIWRQGREVFGTVWSTGARARDQGVARAF